MATTALLKIAQGDKVYNFIHHCVDDLLEGNKSNFNFTNEDIAWTKDEEESAKQFVQRLYEENVLNRFKELNLIGLDLDADLTNSFKECYRIRKDDIFRAVLRKQLGQSDEDVVENIDWKLKWVMGSSKLATLREPRLQVDLRCFKKQNDVRNIVNFEMTIDQVDQLILDLEPAKELLS